MAVDQVKLLARLLEVTRNLSASVELGTYIQSILSAATELTESEAASVLEYDEISQEFYFKFVPWFHRDAVKDIRVPLNGSAAGWVLVQAKPLLLNDVKSDPRHYPHVDEIANFTTRSLMAVPLIVHGEPVGVFEVFNKASDSGYTEEDALILETLASLASAAIQQDLLEANIETSREEARELDRLKNEFIAITSHELRTPLGLILGHSTFLRELVGPEYHDQLDTIIRNASRLKEIVESLSKVDDYESGGARVRPRKASMKRIAEDVVASFREMAERKKINLTTELPKEEDLYVDVDASKIAIALSNLVKNAVTFTNEGGHVNICADQQTGFVKVSVEDNGVGIPTKDLPHVFDRFYQVESHLTRRHGGMGLGLSVAKVMVEMHGGRIWAESMEGVGSTFTFLLPFDRGGHTETSKPFSD